MRKTIPLILLALSTIGAPMAQSDDPQPAAFQALQAASAAPVTGSTSDGGLRLLAFDVPAAGPDAAQQASAFLSAYGAAFGLTGADQEMILRSRSPGPCQDVEPGLCVEGSITMVSFQQAHRGVPVFGGEIRVVIDGDSALGGARVIMAGGSILPDLALEGGLDPFPTIPSSQCVSAAQAFLGRPGSAPLAEPRRMIYDARLLGGAPGAHLVWSATFGDGDPRQVLCDAHTGQIVFNRTFRRSGLDLDLTRQNQSFPYSQDQMGDENGLNSTGQADFEAPSAWWYIKLIYGFYDGVYAWKGTAGNDNGLKVVLDAVNSAGNASFNHNMFGEWIEIGDGSTSFDVIGHEFTHGIVHHTSGLVYANVPGALDESYADTMAVVIDSQDWELGEDRLGVPNDYARNFKHPPDKGQPDKLSGLAGITNNPEEANDYGRVHRNSGILNKAHYLMATGDAHNGRPGFATRALGRARMGTLAFMTLRSLPSTATFFDARAQSISWASTLASKNYHGFVPDHVCAVKNAFAAVEIGPGDFNCDGIDDNFQDPDGDFVPNSQDNCPNNWNPKQYDIDQDGIGDACDNDLDNDGRPDGADNCPSVKNWDQANEDGDSMGDACDPDDDNDNVPDDGDDSGTIGDLPCMFGQTWDCDDNCRLDPNPNQFDGNSNGMGDACDPDTDGDGVYNSGMPGDNCPVTYNASQADGDGDGMGDACDLCPLVADGAFDLSKDPPVPYQPDSDDDGTPDACDQDAFGLVALDFNGQPYNPTQMFAPGGPSFQGMLSGPPDNAFRIPVPLCGASPQPGPILITEIVFGDLEPSVAVRLLDDDGLYLEAVRPGPAGSNTRGLRVAPDCARKYFLEFTVGSGFPGSDEFLVSSSLVPASSPNPWVTPGAGDPPPPPIPDADADGIPDASDSCPTGFDPSGLDLDEDDTGDVCDNCPADVNPGQEDPDADGAGDPCDCAPSDGTAFAPPLGITGLDVIDLPAGGGFAASWDDQGPTAGSGTRYDVFSGSVQDLPPGGDFSTGMCHADDLPGPSLIFGQPGPPQGQAIYMMIRAQNACPGGTASYGTPTRDATSAMSPAPCP